GLPVEIAARLTGDLKAILASHEVATRLEPLGVTGSHASPAQFRALIESDTARWAEIVQSVGITVPCRVLINRASATASPVASISNSYSASAPRAGWLRFMRPPLNDRSPRR